MIIPEQAAPGDRVLSGGSLGEYRKVQCGGSTGVL